MIDDTIMLGVTIAALFVSIGFLAYRGRHRRGYMPFFTGCAASLFIIIGKYILDIPFLFYAGLLLLIAASLWNSWPKKNTTENNPTIQINLEEKQ